MAEHCDELANLTLFESCDKAGNVASKAFYEIDEDPKDQDPNKTSFGASCDPPQRLFDKISSYDVCCPTSVLLSGNPLGSCGGTVLTLNSFSAKRTNILRRGAFAVFSQCADSSRATLTMFCLVNKWQIPFKSCGTLMKKQTTGS
jgi:hypothetical protein